MQRPREEQAGGVEPGRSWAAGAGRAIPGLKLSGRLATRMARRSNGSEEPIRMSGANHSGDGGRLANSLPLPLRPPGLRSGGGLGTVRYPVHLGCAEQFRRRPCGSSCGAGAFRAALGAAIPTSGQSCQPLQDPYWRSQDSPSAGSR